MTLFDLIKNHTVLQDQTSFLYLVVKRLAISELFAALQFKKKIDIISSSPTTNHNIPPKLLEKCLKLDCSETKQECIIEIIKEIYSIATLIQNAWRQQSEHLSIEEVKKDAQVLASAITLTEITEDNLLINIREYSSRLTDSILDKLVRSDLIEPVDLIEPMIIEVFPHINHESLSLSLVSINEKIHQLGYEEIKITPVEKSCSIS